MPWRKRRRMHSIFLRTKILLGISCSCLFLLNTGFTLAIKTSENEECRNPRDADDATTDDCPSSSSEESSTNDNRVNNIIIHQSSVFSHVHQYYRNGTWIDVEDDDDSFVLWNVIDPSTTRIITPMTMAKATKTTTNRIIEPIIQSARNAFEDSTIWSSKTLLQFYQERQDEMAYLIALEMGAPIDLALESHAPGGYYNIEMMLDLHHEHFTYERVLPTVEYTNDPKHARTTVFYEPIGVVLAITPWNWPIHQMTLKVIPALLVGCTVILKPSEYAPLSAMLFTELIHQAQFPPGVFQMIPGDGSIGEFLVQQPQFDMISFTGSTRAGQSIVQNAAAAMASSPITSSSSSSFSFPKVSLELGGKGANLIFADLLTQGSIQPLEEVIEDAVHSAYVNSGQSCNAPTRMLIERSIYEEHVIPMVKTIVQEQIRVDSAHVHGDHLGPIVNEKQYQSIQQYIQSGIEQGARLIVGGLGKAKPHGYYVRPTVFADCQPNMTIFQQEIFGPVLCLTQFENETHAIQLANDTPYGLTHYVQSVNPQRRRRLARALRSGMVELYGGEHDYGAPFGGIKASGNNAKEGGIFGLEEFCIIKSVSGYYNDDDDTDAEVM